MNRQKVLVIGLDGATFTTLQPLLDAGILPNIQRLISEGCAGPLKSVTPPITAPAWVSFMTGNHPGNHGVFDFIDSTPDGLSKRVIHAGDIHSKTLWQILAAEKKTLGVFNVPVTYPPQPVDGFMLTGLLTPPGIGEKCCHPPELLGELEEKFGKFLPDVSHRSYKETEREALIAALTDCMLLKGRYTSHLMKKYDWDFFMTVITETDRLQHAFGDWLYDASSRHPKAGHAAIPGLIEAFYQQVDAQVGDYCAIAGPEATVFIISDHGFGHLARGFFLNKWLHREGLLRFKDEFKMRIAEKLQIVRQSPALLSLIRKLGLKGWRERLFRKSAGSANVNLSLHDAMQASFDWANTRAFMDVGTQQGITINLKGRQPHGIVRPGKDYEELRDSLIARLGAVIDPQTGRPLATEIRKREDVYKGPFAEKAPDIVFTLDGLCTLAVMAVGLGRDLFIDSFWPLLGHHRMDGTFVACGPGIGKGRIEHANLVDVMPTILFAMGLPVPDGLDGKILETIFTADFLRSHPVRRAQSEKSATKDQAPVLTDEETRKIEEQLRGLGYL